jgi:hypothetical protein
MSVFFNFGPEAIPNGTSIADGNFECFVEDLLPLGAEGVLPGRHIVSLLRVFKQFTHLIPSG